MARSSEDISTPGDVGVVVIGRNEGERLERCLLSVRALSGRVVYVDSGSSDGSIELARALGAIVEEIDLQTPFTAARARNAGFKRLLEAAPAINYVYFVDGDCEVFEGWIEKARLFLRTHSDVAIVWGQRREKYPDQSIYNMLCEMEWRSYPIGETKACGGDALIRVDVMREMNGYRPDLVCGEEPELCVRVRKKGWRIWHLDEDMTLHDAAIHRFGQWWRRMLRGGYGFAQGAALHGAPPERHWVAESRRAWIWGLWIPVTILVSAIAFGWWSLLLAGVYPLQLIRLARRGRGPARARWWWAGAMVVAKFPEVLGQMKFRLDRFRRVDSKLIEYK
jgi:glycosyltransferase involved in cell wall biosynthesis